MPPDPKDITGISVKSSMLALQKDMTEARQRYHASCRSTYYVSVYLCVKEVALYSNLTVIVWLASSCFCYCVVVTDPHEEI